MSPIVLDTVNLLIEWKAASQQPVCLVLCTYLHTAFADVKLLREGCEIYRKQFIQMWGLDPFIEAITGASATHKAFRKKYLKPNSIVVVSNHGLCPEIHCSAITNGWLTWLMKKNDVTIRTSLNGSEIKVGKYRLDGYLVIILTNIHSNSVIHS